MNAIEKITDFLGQYPFVKYERREDAIRAFRSSEKGFEVALLVSPGLYTLYYATFHTEFAEEDEDMAVNGFINGLSNAVRLRVTSRGNIDYLWTVEFRDGNTWRSGSTVWIFKFPFWKTKQTRHLQNDYFIATELQDSGSI